MADHARPGPGAAEGWSEPELERALRDLGSRIAYPATPDLARAVRGRQIAAARPERAGWAAVWSGWFANPNLRPRRAIAATVVALVLAGAALLATFPGAGDTVAGWLGVRGIRIVFVEQTPTPAPTPTVPSATPGTTPTAPSLGDNLLLGEPVSLTEAQARVGFPIRLPDSPLLGRPDEVYLRRLADGAMVTLLYYPRPGLPAAAGTGVGLLFVQFEAPEDTFWGEKGVGPANEVEPVEIDGDEGLWIGGTHLLFVAPDPALGVGVFAGERRRVAANVLLWDKDGVTYRMESALSRPTAIDLAESARPIATPPPATPS